MIDFHVNIAANNTPTWASLRPEFRQDFTADTNHSIDAPSTSPAGSTRRVDRSEESLRRFAELGIEATPAFAYSSETDARQ